MKTRQPTLWKCPKCNVSKPKEEFLDFMYHDDSHECCECAEAREKANEAYLNSPEFHAKCEAKREEAKKDLKDYDLVEGYCRDCTSPVWLYIKRGETKMPNLSCGCWGRQIQNDTEYFRRMG